MNLRQKGTAMQIQQFFEYSVDNYPNNIALVCDNQSLTYLELEHYSNRLANYLLSEGLCENSIVALLLERSVESYIAILATLKIGATYVPIDVEHPDERVNFILSDMAFQAVLTSSTQMKRTGLQLPRAFLLDEIKSELAKHSSARPLVNQDLTDSENLCYVIYTSGSTGKPKGVEITHRSICHYVAVASDIYEMTAQDRVYQGFSLAFDASLEELWMAFANGAALIACTNKDTRSGVDLIDFLQTHKVSVFSTVPTLLSTLEGKLPDLRLLILGGESCTASLVRRWSRPGLRIMNTYGPTEATVIATYADCAPDKPVTIGKPLPGYETLILDDNLQPVAIGETGELCIGGRGLAKGYVNRPDFNAKKFINNPQNKTQRLYRTGDLVAQTANGDLQFLGRVDDQIKLRGFRIELNEIEAVMMEFEGINQAVVSLQNLAEPTLVAYLKTDKNTAFELERFKLFLRTRLPIYMIPSLFEKIEAFPLLASGKVDRKQLPQPTQTVKTREYIAPKTALEKQIATSWETSLELESISIEADFFYDLGGHSLSAAKVVSNLRKIPALKNISILDLYQNPSIRKLALKFKKITSNAQNSKVHEVHEQRERNTSPNWMYYLCGTGQALGCMLQYAVSAWQLLAVIICYSWATERQSFFSWGSLGIFLTLFLAMPIISLTFTIAMKWLLLGRVKPGHYKLWGWFYFRWWLVDRLQKNVFSAKHLIGSPLIILYYRLLGAKIGKNCYIGSVNISTHDLISIGDNTSLGYDVRALGYIVEDGWLKIGHVTIGSNCFIGARALVNINTVMEDEAVLDHLSMLPKNSVIAKGQFFAGSPACLTTTPSTHITKQHQKLEQSSIAKNISFGILHYLCLVFVMMVYYTCYLPGIMLVSHFYEQSHYLTTILVATPLGAVTFLSLYFLSIFLCKKILMDKVKPGNYPLQSFYFLRQWTVVKMLDIDEIYVMADSLYFPLFLKFLGANIGKRVEMGETPHIIPDLISIQDGGFTASSVAMSWPEIYNGSISFASVKVGNRGFVGNMSLLPSGSHIGDGALLGCMSITPPNNRAADANTAWLGSPAVFLPKRELFTGFSETETFNPSKKLYRQRLAVEFARIISPTVFSLILLFNMLYVLDFLLGNFSLLNTFLILPFAEAGITFGLVGFIILMKWVMLGRIKASATPTWNMFIWKNDVREYLYSYFINQHLTYMILGTPFVAFLFRAMGAKIGKRFFTASAEFAEFDLIAIGDEVCINAETLIQTHLYEDRIFKLSNLVIKSGCNIGDASMILYDTVMEKNATLGSLSLLMKGERLPANTRWEGIPAQSVSVYDYYVAQPVAETNVTADDSPLPELG